MLPGKFIGYALSTGGGWTEDLIIADWHDIENCVASEVHVKRFKSKEFGINKFDRFLCGFLRELVGVPNFVGDDRKEWARQKGHLAEGTGRSDHKPLFLCVVRVRACCTLLYYTARH